MLRESIRFECRFSYPAIHQRLRELTGEPDWMGFCENGADPLKSFHDFVRAGILEKDGGDVVIYIDL